MARIQLPSVRQQVQQPVGFDAPRVAPLQDAAPQQLQALGQAQQAFGVSGSRISADLQDEYDAAILNKADLAADGVLNEEFGGYLSLQGEQATGTAKKDATAAATKRIRAIQESGLKTAAQRTLFEQQMTSRMQEWTQRADRHERDQVRNFAFGMHTAKAQSEGMDAAVTVGTPMFLAHKEQMLAHVDSAADLQGLGADQKKLLRLGATTTLHQTIIKNMVSGGHSTPAQDYLEGAKDEMTPEAQNAMGQLVKEANMDQQAFYAAETVSRAEPNLLKQIDMLKELSLTKENPLDVRVMQRAIQQLEHAADRRNAETFRTKRETLTEAQELISAGRQLTPEVRQKLQDTGQQWKLDAWQEANGASRTSEYGRRAWLTVTDDELLAMGSPDAVFDHYNTEVDTPKLEYLMSRYRQAASAQGKGSARTAEQEQKDIYAVDFRNEALFQFRRLAEVPDGWALSDRKEDAAMRMRFETFERNLKLKSEALAKERKEVHPRQETINDAGTSILRSGTYVDDGGSPRSVSTMTPEGVQRASVRITPAVAKETGQEFFDMNQATTEMRNAVVAELKKDLNGVEPDEQLIWDRMAKKYAQANVSAYDAKVTEARRGRQLLFDRYTQAKNEPKTVQKAWRLANSRYGGYSTPQGQVSMWDAKPIQPSTAELNRAMAEILMDEFGWKIADAHGVDRDGAFEILTGERDAAGWRYDSGMTKEQKAAMLKVGRNYGTGGVAK